MTYYGARDLAESFRTVRKNTIGIAQDIPEDKYSFRPAPDVRSVAQLLTHVALTHHFQHQVHAVEKRTTLKGFDFPTMMRGLLAEEQTPRTKPQIIELLESEGEKWAGFVEGLSDTFLGESVEMPPGMKPPSKSRFEMILGVKEHEMHHRGQLMMIERMIGIVPHLTREMQARMAARSQTAAQA